MDKSNNGPLTLGEFAELYGEDMITAEMLDDSLTGAAAAQLIAMPDKIYSKHYEKKGYKNGGPPAPLAPEAAPCDQNGGCQFRETCGTYKLACQSFYQFVQHDRIRPKYRAAHPVQIPCRDMYSRVFTTENTEDLPVPPLQYILNEDETVALNSLAIKQKRVA